MNLTKKEALIRPYKLARLQFFEKKQGSLLWNFNTVNMNVLYKEISQARVHNYVFSVTLLVEFDQIWSDSFKFGRMVGYERIWSNFAEDLIHVFFSHISMTRRKSTVSLLWLCSLILFLLDLFLSSYLIFIVAERISWENVFCSNTVVKYIFLHFQTFSDATICVNV